MWPRNMVITREKKKKKNLEIVVPMWYQQLYVLFNKLFTKHCTEARVQRCNLRIGRDYCLVLNAWGFSRNFVFQLQ